MQTKVHLQRGKSMAGSIVIASATSERLARRHGSTEVTPKRRVGIKDPLVDCWWSQACPWRKFDPPKKTSLRLEPSLAREDLRRRGASQLRYQNPPQTLHVWSRSPHSSGRTFYFRNTQKRCPSFRWVQVR